MTEVDRQTLAARVKGVVVQAGGDGIWLKPPARTHHPPASKASLQVFATPPAYLEILSAVQREAAREDLEMESSAGVAGPGMHGAILNIQKQGRHILQIQLREVPRLLRAAIVIDDMGQDLEAARKLLALDYPITFSVLPYLRYTHETAEEAHRNGREVMLHLPMEPDPGAHASPGQGVILVGMNGGEVRRVILDDLADVPFVVGVNNHMGSRATRDAALMADVMRTLAPRRLYFIDSRTTAGSRALDAAENQNVPAFYRAVFLDDTETVSYTLGQLREFRRTVEKEGVALAIGHPHPTTIAALAKYFPEMERADIELVTPSQIVRLPEIARLRPPGSAK